MWPESSSRPTELTDGVRGVSLWRWRFCDTVSHHYLCSTCGFSHQGYLYEQRKNSFTFENLKFEALVSRFFLLQEQTDGIDGWHEREGFPREFFVWRRSSARGGGQTGVS